MLYQIAEVTEDGWVSIETSAQGAEGIMHLARAYQNKIGGTLVKPYEDDEQYMIKGDPYKLTFQYDSIFGSIVILNDLADQDKVIEELQSLFKTLKEV